MRDYGARAALALWFFTLVTPSMSHMDDGGHGGFLRGNPTTRRLMTSSIDTTASVVGVEIYVPDDAADVLSTSTDSELVEELEDDDRVTVQSIQLGALLCDSLVNAENAPTLRFSLTPGETFLANRTSYTVHNGSIFSDGISRKVWTGNVINDQEEVSSQTASMTWGEQCDVETFLLEVPTRFVNGTLIVAKTLPCLDGGELDICIVELEIDLPDESESELEDTAGDTRQLRDRQVHVNTTGGAVAPVERHLQSATTQIDLMFFYTPEARNILFVSDSQMQSVLADSVTTVNEAMINSNIDLQFFLVRVEPIPYTEESDVSSVVLGNFQASSEVAELRDTYGADLVHLVTDLDGGCGRANLAAEPNEDAAFGVVDPYCFFQFSHTHEIAHNMGCYHDRYTSFTEHEYAHGYRYCDGDLPYRTIMSYDCFMENGQRVPRENYFSNPDVIFNDRPTGTAENNCARRLTETMGDVANYRESTTVAITPAPTAPITPAPTTPITPAPTAPITPAPTTPITPAPTAPITPAPTAPITPAPTTPITPAPTTPITPAPTTPITPAPTAPITPTPTTPITPAPTAPITPAPTVPITPTPTTPVTPAPTAPITPAPTAQIAPAPTTPITPAPTAPITPAPTAQITPAPTTPITPAPTTPITPAPTTPITPAPTAPITPAPTAQITPAPTTPITSGPTTPITPAPTAPITLAPTIPITAAPTLAPAINVVATPTSTAPTTGPTTCSNGITGVERNGYCCPVGCGTCGGFGCSQRAREAGLTSEDCCVSRIEESGIYCDDSATAPCIVGAAPTPAPTLGSVTPVPTSVVPTAALDSPTPMPSSLPPSAAPESATPSPTSLAPTATLDSATPMPSSLPPSATPESSTPSPTSLAPTAALDSPTPMPSSLPPSAAPESVTPGPTSLAPTATLDSGVSQPVATPSMAEFVEVGESTTVVVSANAFDERIPDSGCAPDGCVAANTRDGSLDTRWSCKESLLGGANCKITYEFGEPQDLDMIRIAFYKGAERTRRLKIKINGFSFSEVESSGQIDDFEDFVLSVSGASEVVLEALGLGSHEWISLTEVQFILP